MIHVSGLSVYVNYTGIVTLDPTSAVTAVDGGDIVLPTSPMFSSAGYCGVLPRFTELELFYNGETILDCNNPSECEENFSIDLDTLGNVTLSSVGEGVYIFALRQCCPPTVVSTTYTVTFDSASESYFVCVEFIRISK